MNILYIGLITILSLCHIIMLQADAAAPFDIINTFKSAGKQKSSDAKKWMKISKCVTATKKINIVGYPNAFNPSIIETDSGYLMLFRYCPDRRHDEFSFIGIVRLNHAFEQTSKPQILDTRVNNVFFDPFVSPHAEDPRIMALNGKIYVFYNDNPHVFLPGRHDRRDMFIAEIIESNGIFHLKMPTKIKHATKFKDVTWQKNWVPFDWDGSLLLGYTIQPHEVLFTDMETGVATCIYKTLMGARWELGELRGGTPALLVDGEYMSFFHSCTEMASESSDGKKMLHYFMGAYTFTSLPPFTITKISEFPIIGKDFYEDCVYHKRVIFPGGFVLEGPNIYVVYGKDEREIWVATINKAKLEKSLISAR